jgi:predicted glycosyltransferase
MIRAIYAEHRQLKKWCRIHPIDGIISDNRPGIFQPLIPSVYITHQLKVLSGWTTQISSFLHRKLIHRFDECWVPDLASEIKISGELGNANHYRIPVRYIGVLSRMIPQRLPIDHEVVCVLSGPEPQRSILEEQLITTFLDHDKSVLLIQGLVSSPKDIRTLGAITIVPFLNSRELEMSLNKSNWVICRSGYTSIMDLLVLRKKVFFIPTPGQNEQEYLAKRMEQLEFAPFCKQSEFSIEQLLRIEQFKGMKLEVEEPHFEKLFDLFDRK